MTTQPIRIEYENLLKHHDWWFEFSEDFSVWKKGKRELEIITHLQKVIDKDSVLWDTYAPDEMKRSIV